MGNKGGTLNREYIIIYRGHIPGAQVIMHGTKKLSAYFKFAKKAEKRTRLSVYSLPCRKT